MMKCRLSNSFNIQFNAQSLQAAKRIRRAQPTNATNFTSGHRKASQGSTQYACGPLVLVFGASKPALEGFLRLG